EGETRLQARGPGLGRAHRVAACDFRQRLHSYGRVEWCRESCDCSRESAARRARLHAVECGPSCTAHRRDRRVVYSRSAARIEPGRLFDARAVRRAMAGAPGRDIAGAITDRSGVAMLV